MSIPADNDDSSGIDDDSIVDDIPHNVADNNETQCHKQKIDKKRENNIMETMVWQELNKLKEQLKEKGIFNPVLDHVCPIKVRSPKAKPYSFLCPHNTCGQLYKENCNNPFNCCHHTFFINPKSAYSTVSFLKCFFCKTNNENDENVPRLKMHWNRFVDLKKVKDKESTPAIGLFLKNNVRKHLEKCNNTMPLPHAVKRVKEVANDKKIDVVHFKDFHQGENRNSLESKSALEIEHIIDGLGIEIHKGNTTQSPTNKNSQSQKRPNLRQLPTNEVRENFKRKKSV